MSKVAIVVPNVSSPYLYPGINSSGQGVPKSKTSIPIVTLCYPGMGYTLSSDMKIVGIWTKFKSYGSAARTAVGANNTFTFDAGSSTMHCNFTFTQAYGPFGSSTWNVTAANDLTAGTVIFNYTEAAATSMEIVAFEIAGYVNT